MVLIHIAELTAMTAKDSNPDSLECEFCAAVITPLCLITFDQRRPLCHTLSLVVCSPQCLDRWPPVPLSCVVYCSLSVSLAVLYSLLCSQYFLSILISHLSLLCTNTMHTSPQTDTTETCCAQVYLAVI